MKAHQDEVLKAMVDSQVAIFEAMNSTISDLLDKQPAAPAPQGVGDHLVLNERA